MSRHYKGSIIVGPAPYTEREVADCWEGILQKADKALKDGTREPYDDTVPLSARSPTNCKSKRTLTEVSVGIDKTRERDATALART